VNPLGQPANVTLSNTGKVFCSATARDRQIFLCSRRLMGYFDTYL
jgi:hypothetical protein